MAHHEGQSKEKLELHRDSDNVAHMHMNKKAAADLIKHNRITIVGSDCNISWSGEGDQKLKYITIDIV